MSDKRVELKLEDFEKIVKKERKAELIIEELKNELEECKKANKFLNEQIKEYNKKFTVGE